jgi:hypothetical protein
MPKAILIAREEFSYGVVPTVEDFCLEMYERRLKCNDASSRN